MAKIDRLTLLSADKELENLKIAYTAGGNIKRGSIFEKQFGSSLKS